MTNGLNVAQRIRLSGAGLVIINQDAQYSAVMAVDGTLALTGTVKDVAGTTVSSAHGNSVTWISYDTDVATVSGGTVTAVKVGHALIEARFPTNDNTDGIDFVYVQCDIQVNP